MVPCLFVVRVNRSEWETWGYKLNDEEEKNDRRAMNNSEREGSFTEKKK